MGEMKETQLTQNNSPGAGPVGRANVGRVEPVRGNIW